MNQPINNNSLPVELYTDDEVLIGQMSCPSSSRLLDLLNNSGLQAFISRDKFCIFDGFSCLDSGSAGQEPHRLYVRKSVVHFVAVDDLNLGRGAGADRDRKTYPVVSKSSVRMTIKMKTRCLLERSTVVRHRMSKS